MTLEPWPGAIWFGRGKQDIYNNKSASANYLDGVTTVLDTTYATKEVVKEENILKLMRLHGKKE